MVEGCWLVIQNKVVGATTCQKGITQGDAQPVSPHVVRGVRRGSEIQAAKMKTEGVDT